MKYEEINGFGMDTNVPRKLEEMKRMMMMITQVYEIDLVRQEIELIVHVSFYLNATSLSPMPFVVYSYTSKANQSLIPTKSSRKSHRIVSNPLINRLFRKIVCFDIILYEFFMW